MQMTKKELAVQVFFLVAVWLVLLLGGCSRGSPEPPANSATAASNADDSDVYKPLKPRPAPAPPPLVKKGETAQNQPAQSDPDVYVPEKPRARPATQPKTDQAAKNDSDAQKTDKPSQPPTLPAQPKKDESAQFDPDVYVPEKPKAPPKIVQQVIAGTKSTNDAINNAAANPMDLKAQVSLYQSGKTDEAMRLALEKQFIATSREALRVFLGFGVLQPATPPPPDWLYSVGAQLWDSPFINFLNIQHQVLTTLSERPTAVALAVLIPNDVMRTDLRRTLSRHWSEGPKAISALPAANSPLAEPGFITVLKSLIRENRVRSSPQSRSAKSVKSTYDLDNKAFEQSKSTSNEEWNKYLEILVRDYCRQSHMASLARSAAAYRDGAATSREKRKVDSPFPLLPDCEIAAAYSIDWPGEYVSRLPNMEGDDLSLNYQRIEKRMKLSKPLNYYRRQMKSCIEHPVQDGWWLDGFVELKGEEPLRSVDVLITGPTNGALKSAIEEQELTVEILSIEVRKSHE
jgi:hypothetical protein